MSSKKMIGLVVLLTVCLSAVVFADTQTTTLSWVIPSSVSHTLSYGGGCSTSAMYFVEDDSSANGTDTMVLPKEGSSVSDANCQSSSVSAITVNNGGNVIIDVNASITTSLESGVTLKGWLGSTGCGTNGVGGWEASCSNAGSDDSTVATTSTCVSIGDSSLQVLADVAVSGSSQLCLAADFTGLSEGTTTDTLQTEAAQSSG